MLVKELRGSIPALVTPFRDGKVDWDALAHLVDWQIEMGSQALVAVGTTGESPTLTHDEHKEVVAFVVEASKGRVPVIAGAGSNATHEAVAFARQAEADGADASLVVTPYYNRPTQEGLFAHFAAVHEASRLPIIIYNIPGRSSVDMELETMKRLARLPRIVGVKDATSDAARISLQRHEIGSDFIQLSGNDDAVLGDMASGAVGCISVTANVAPALCADVMKACHANDYARARALNDRLVPLHRALFVEASPAPSKFALEALGHARADVRLPLRPLSEGAQAVVLSALRYAGLTGSAAA